MQPKIVKLSNGLDLILHPMSSVQSVAVYVAVGAGPRYETRETAGLAHFLEHMLFEGTKKLPSSKEVSRFIERVGGISSAWTSKEYVVYYAKVQKKHLKVALDYLSEILFNSQLDENAIKKEKRIILEEYKRAKDNPESEIWELWFKWAWGDNQWLGRSTFGDELAILNINRKKLLDYLSIFYHPSNMCIAIVGNFSIAKVKKFTNKSFGQIQKKDIFKSKKIRFTLKKDNVKIVNADTNQTQLALGIVTGIPFDHEDRFVIRVIVDILSNGVSSRIFHKIVYEEGLAYSVGAYSLVYTNTNIICVSGGFAKENIERGVRVILEELEKLKIIKVSKKELEEAKEKDKAGIIFSVESPDSIANWYASTQLLEKRIMPIEEIFKKIDEVKAEDIQKAARKYFVLKNLCLMIRGTLDKKYKKSIESICKETLS